MKLRAVAWRVAAAVVVASALPVAVLRCVPPATSAFMLARTWPFASGSDACSDLRYQWTPARDISKNVFRAVIAGEDQRFAEHDGFDFDAIEDAIEESEASGRSRGASTISQQVAKNLFLWSGRSFARKGLEAWFTVFLETFWPKRRILEVYVNVAQFGRCTFGVGAASQDFFHKPASALSLEEAGLLAAVLPDPVDRHVQNPSGRVRARAAWIARQARNVELPE